MVSNWGQGVIWNWSVERSSAYLNGQLQHVDWKTEVHGRVKREAGPWRTNFLAALALALGANLWPRSPIMRAVMSWDGCDPPATKAWTTLSRMTYTLNGLAGAVRHSPARRKPVENTNRSRCRESYTPKLQAAGFVVSPEFYWNSLPASVGKLISYLHANVLDELIERHGARLRLGRVAGTKRSL
jgi:hypothetical protein